MGSFPAQLTTVVAQEVHSDSIWRAAQAISEYCRLNTRVTAQTERKKYLPIVQTYVHQLLSSNAMADAARILWSPNQFTPEPGSVGAIWNLFDTSDHGLILGAASMGKSYSLGVRLFLEWVKDPEWTGIRVIGPSEDHLEQNLFSHLVGLHSQATLPMPGLVGDLFIGMDRRNQTSSIRGIVIPKGNVKKAGRLQGGHRKPRLLIHPIYGPLSRMFIFIDEIENVPMGIWHDVDNVLSNISGDGGFKIFGAYNPTNLGDEVAKRAEPTFGWNALDEEVHFRWKSSRGWDVLRIDAELCENVIQDKIVYPGLQTRSGLELIAQNAGGTDAPGYLTMGRGMYPKQGTKISIIPAGMLAKMIGEFIWMDPPIPVGAADLALDGGDSATYTLGKWGMATGIKFPPSLEFPQGRTVMFKDSKGHVTPRWGLLAESQFPLPPGETVAMKTSILDINKKAGVRPEYFACDRTGHGAGVADLIRFEWSGAIHDVNYSSGASIEKLMQEDTKTCEEQYERMFSELWFGLRMWGEFGYLLISPKVDLSKLTQQLTQRQFRTGLKTKVESKKDYKLRGFKSPDEADSLTLFVFAARKGSGVIPSMKGDAIVPNSVWEEDWPGQGMTGGCKIDVSNQSDFLRTDPEDMSIL